MVTSCLPDRSNMAFLWLLSCFALVGAASSRECRDPGDPRVGLSGLELVETEVPSPWWPCSQATEGARGLCPQ